MLFNGKINYRLVPSMFAADGSILQYTILSGKRRLGLLKLEIKVAQGGRRMDQQLNATK